jgi:hypothetical protein
MYQGYASWMMCLEVIRQDIRQQLRLLDNIAENHAAMLPILINQNQDRRVVFLAQNVSKRNAFVKKSHKSNMPKM